MCRINTVDLASYGIQTFRGVIILPHGQPVCSAAAAFSPPFLMSGYSGIEHIDILYAHRVTGAHHGGDIVRIKNIFQHNNQILLSLIQYCPYSRFPFGCHNSPKLTKITLSGKNRAALVRAAELRIFVQYVYPTLAFESTWNIHP